ncbi:hypothetical protein [Pseudarthrobacter sp. IC2-21]|uniref:hypothetical protein n=1 Tax=Pseudarthrobacter sp. IC2-21 TaxID=3092262 RepID=UPI002A69F004|nr:hypothetical protein [Pseudarthrobacter sp. IC2-21]
MDKNPVLEPKLATPALILSSVATLTCVIYLVGSVTVYGQSAMFRVLAILATVILAAALGAIWFARARRLRSWTAAANEKRKRLSDLKRTRGTTTEVTVLSVDALEPTGSWITINWNRFDHIQRAWLEALNEPIWPGSVLLISPDPIQVFPGAPWPATYYIRASDCLAWAPG